MEGINDGEIKNKEISQVQNIESSHEDMPKWVTPVVVLVFLPFSLVVCLILYFINFFYI